MLEWIRGTYKDLMRGFKYVKDYKNNPYITNEIGCIYDFSDECLNAGIVNYIVNQAKR